MRGASSGGLPAWQEANPGLRLWSKDFSRDAEADRMQTEIADLPRVVAAQDELDDARLFVTCSEILRDAAYRARDEFT